MRAMVLEKSGPIDSSPLKLRDDYPDPVPAAGEVRVRVICCAICRTDLHIIEEDLPPQKRPIVPGHQVVGIVDQLGPGCMRLKIGQRIGIAWLRYTCGQCHYCKTGRENLCPYSKYTGWHADGGYAQYAVVPEAFAYEIPRDFADDLATPLLCAGIIGYRSLMRSGLRDGEKLAIYGFGSSAHIIMQIAKHRGCEVYVVTRATKHQQFARDLGAAWASGTSEGMPEKAQAAIIFAPAGELVPDALAHLDRGGVVALAGIHMSPIPSMSYDELLFQERDIHPVTANTREDGRHLLEAAERAHVRPHIQRYPLERANEALQDLKDDRIDGTGVLMV